MRERHLRDVDRLHDRVDAHKRELAALTDVLDGAKHVLRIAATTS
jgi:hypothetical protein